MQTQKINFTGNLYGRIGNHLTKPILCCPHGDAKFIKTINKIAQTNPQSLKITMDTSTSNKLLIETSDLPELNLFEKIFYRVSKAQRKAIAKRKAGVIDSFIYKINEFEYNHIKTDYTFIRKKTLKNFEDNIKAIAPKELQEKLKEFFY